MRVSRTEHITNEEILQMVETEREIMDTVRSRQKRWLGHILRHDSLLRITLEGQIQGKKAYGETKNNASGLATGHCKRYRATGPHRATGPESTWK